jgi:hypothetical protein
MFGYKKDKSNEIRIEQLLKKNKRLTNQNGRLRNTIGDLKDKPSIDWFIQEYEDVTNINKKLGRENDRLRKEVDLLRKEVYLFRRSPIERAFSTVIESEEKIRCLENKIKEMQYGYLESAKCQGQKHKAKAEKLENQLKYVKIRKDEYLDEKNKHRAALVEFKEMIRSDDFAKILANAINSRYMECGLLSFGDLVDTIQTAINIRI